MSKMRSNRPNKQRETAGAKAPVNRRNPLEEAIDMAREAGLSLSTTELVKLAGVIVAGEHVNALRRIATALEQSK